MDISPVGLPPTTATANTAVAPEPKKPAKEVAAEIAKPAPFDPLPALHPTLQDKIAITQALLLMRQAV